MEKIKNNSLKNYSSEIPAQTLVIIRKLNNNEYLCKCNKPIFINDEVYSCKNCYKNISHLKCLNIKRLNLKNSTKIKIYCEFCNEDIPSLEEPYYNCYCGKFYSNQDNIDFNPNLIPHGCGVICNFLLFLLPRSYCCLCQLLLQISYLHLQQL